MTIKTYDPSKIVVTFNGVELKGFTNWTGTIDDDIEYCEHAGYEYSTRQHRRDSARAAHRRRALEIAGL